AVGKKSEEENSRLGPLVMGAAILAAVALIGGLVFYLTQTRSASDWEQSNHDELLSLKQKAEDLDANGQKREAFEKYQELERLVAGRQIIDPYLRSELEKSWQRKDRLYDLLANGGVPSVAATAPAA